MRRDDTPFGRHRLYYLSVTYAAIVAAAFVSPHVLYRLYLD
jgi:hypothetical protein